MVDYVANLYAATEVEKYGHAHKLDTGDLSALQVRGHEIGQPIPVYAVRRYEFEDKAQATKEQLRKRLNMIVDTGDLGELQVRGVSRADE